MPEGWLLPVSVLEAVGIPVSVPDGKPLSVAEGEPVSVLEGIPVSVLEGTPVSVSVSVPDGIPVSVLEGTGRGVVGPLGGMVRVKVVVTVSTPPDPLGARLGGSGPAAAPANARPR